MTCDMGLCCFREKEKCIQILTCASITTSFKPRKVEPGKSRRSIFEKSHLSFLISVAFSTMRVIPTLFLKIVIKSKYLSRLKIKKVYIFECT